MKTIKRKAAMLLLASFLVLSMLGLAACGKKSTKDIVTAATEKANNAKSMTYDMDMEMAMSIMGQEMTMKMYGSGEMINEPVQLSMIMNMDISAAGNSQANLMKIYATKEDDDFVVYMGAGTGEDDIAWSKTTEDASTLNQYNARESLDIYVDAAESFKETETEKINEKNATKYEGVITGDAVNKVIQESGVMEQFASMGIDESMVETISNISADIPLTLWITEKDEEIVQYRIDLTDYITEFMKAAMKDQGVGSEDMFALDITSMVETITVTGYDNVSEIQIPDEALNAPALDDYSDGSDTSDVSDVSAVPDIADEEPTLEE